MSRAQIREAVLGWESDADDAAISMQVSRARRKLSEAGADPIATVWGWGTSGEALRTGARGRGACRLLRHRALLRLRSRRSPRRENRRSFMALLAAINAGFVYEASWGAGPMRARSGGPLARDGVSGSKTCQTAYRYLILNKDGYVLMTDLEGHTARGRDGNGPCSTRRGSGTVEIEGGGSGPHLRRVPAPGTGGACALVSEYLPQWVSRDLAGLLPNPQNLMLVGAAAGKRARVALVARRASRVISRKMAPPQRRRARRRGGARLRGRQHQRARGERRPRRDGRHAGLPSPSRSRPAGPSGAGAASRWRRSPTTSRRRSPVLRANADFVAEELEDEKDADLAAARARHSRQCRKARRLRAPAHRGLAPGSGWTEGPMRPAELCEQVLAEAAQIARARGVTFNAATGPAVAGAPEAPLDRTAGASRREPCASAAEHARSRVAVSCDVAGGHLVIEVADDGPGFSPAALERGCERLFHRRLIPLLARRRPPLRARPPRPPRRRAAHGGSVSLRQQPLGRRGGHHRGPL